VKWRRQLNAFAPLVLAYGALHPHPANAEEADREPREHEALFIIEEACTLNLHRFCAGHLSRYATLASSASGLMPPIFL
jgi:hypothetical protein